MSVRSWHKSPGSRAPYTIPDTHCVRFLLSSGCCTLHSLFDGADLLTYHSHYLDQHRRVFRHDLPEDLAGDRTAFDITERDRTVYMSCGTDSFVQTDDVAGLSDIEKSSLVIRIILVDCNLSCDDTEGNVSRIALPKEILAGQITACLLTLLQPFALRMRKDRSESIQDCWRRRFGRLVCFHDGKLGPVAFPYYDVDQLCCRRTVAS